MGCLFPCIWIHICFPCLCTTGLWPLICNVTYVKPFYSSTFTLPTPLVICCLLTGLTPRSQFSRAPRCFSHSMESRWLPDNRYNCFHKSGILDHCSKGPQQQIKTYHVVQIILILHKTSLLPHSLNPAVS